MSKIAAVGEAVRLAGGWKRRHPKMLKRIKRMLAKELMPGNTLRISITDAEGNEHYSQMKLYEEDVAFIKALEALFRK